MKANKIRNFIFASLIASVGLTSVAFNTVSAYAETLHTNASATVIPNLLPTFGTYMSPVGTITWFRDTYGDNGQVLQPKDCATKGVFDNPVDGTSIYTFKGTNGPLKPGNDKEDILRKEDWGTLPNAVLDVKLPEMAYFGVSAGTTAAGTVYGSFTGYYYHF